MAENSTYKTLCSHSELLRSFISKTKTTTFSSYFMVSCRYRSLCFPTFPLLNGFAVTALCHRHEVIGLFAATWCLVIHHAFVIHTNSASFSSGRQKGQQIDTNVINVYSTAPLECQNRCLLGKRMRSKDCQVLKSLSFKRRTVLACSI